MSTDAFINEVIRVFGARPVSVVLRTGSAAEGRGVAWCGVLD
jgi:hypothetical protein